MCAQVWGLDKGYCQHTFMCPSTCNSVAVTATGLVASGHFDGALRFWDLRSRKQVRVVCFLLAL